MARWLMLLSDIFSVITVALCLVLKVPQIICLAKSNAAEGLSLKGLLLELSSYTVTMMYNYVNKHALLSYLEYPIIVVQEYVLIGLVMHIKNLKPSLFLLVFTFYSSVCLAFAFGLLDKFLLTFLVPFTTPVGAVSKIMQLVEIISTKNSQSVSTLTWFLSVFTNVTRIYTVYMDSSDINLLLNFTISSVLSGSVMCAAIYYRSESSPVIKSDMTCKDSTVRKKVLKDQ